MTPILITLLVTAPVIALGTWLYLRRRMLSPRMRVGLMWVFFLFILLSWPIVLGLWYVHRDRWMATFARLFLQCTLAWIVAASLAGAQLFRLCRNKGEL